jgi:hypothetical protein
MRRICECCWKYTTKGIGKQFVEHVEVAGS